MMICLYWGHLYGNRADVFKVLVSAEPLMVMKLFHGILGDAFPEFRTVGYGTPEYY